MNKQLIILLLTICPLSTTNSQNTGLFSGSFQSTTHYYLPDLVLANPKPLNPLASNNYLQIQYMNGPFSGGFQYEAYLPPLSGYPYQLEGNRITNRYFRFSRKLIDITVGDFYEQFGNGLIFRAFESRELGINNSLDGVKVIFRPVKFVRITGVYGKQKKYLEEGHSFVRGLDADLNIDSLIHTSLGIKLGASIISRYEPYTGSVADFPATVNNASIRISLNRNDLEINSEYAFKTDDPSSGNLYTYSHGNAFLINGTYTRSGFGTFLSLRFLNNMDFRSERDSEGNYLMINYLPSNTKQHSYLLSNIYPYPTQSRSEMSVQGEINYFIPAENLFGGKYGTGIRLNLSQARGLSLNVAGGNNALISIGKNIFFQDINFEVSKKWSPKFKSILTYINIIYDKSVIEGPGYDLIKSHLAIADLKYRITSFLSIRGELQHLWTIQDHGNWAAALTEFGYSPHWILFCSDMIDYQYDQKVHYFNAGIGYNMDYLRITIGYGRQREGLICAGGICQRVPSYKGFNLKLNVNF
jgi:hypothetical protein